MTNKNKIDNYGTTALILSCWTELVKLLLDKGADVKATNNYSAALRWACMNGETEVAKLLLDNGADVNAKDCYGNTPLIYACYCGDTKLVKLLLDKGADVEARDQNGFDVQMIAKDNEYTEIVELLQQYTR